MLELDPPPSAYAEEMVRLLQRQRQLEEDNQRLRADLAMERWR